MSAPSANPQLDVTSHIDLTRADWSLATWRSRAVYPTRPPVAFNLRSAMSRLRRVTTGAHYYAPFDWSRVGIADRLDPREAAFWFLAMTECSRERLPEQVANDLHSHALPLPLSREQVRRRNCPSPTASPRFWGCIASY